MDDVLVLGGDFADQIENLRRVFLMFLKYNLKLKPSENQESAFHSLIETLVHAAVLSYPTTDAVFVLYTDVSQHTI